MPNLFVPSQVCSSSDQTQLHRDTPHWKKEERGSRRGTKRTKNLKYGNNSHLHRGTVAPSMQVACTVESKSLTLLVTHNEDCWEWLLYTAWEWEIIILNHSNVPNNLKLLNNCSHPTWATHVLFITGCTNEAHTRCMYSNFSKLIIMYHDYQVNEMLLLWNNSWLLQTKSNELWKTNLLFEVKKKCDEDYSLLKSSHSSLLLKGSGWLICTAHCMLTSVIPLWVRIVLTFRFSQLACTVLSTCNHLCVN